MLNPKQAGGEGAAWRPSLVGLTLYREIFANGRVQGGKKSGLSK